MANSGELQLAIALHFGINPMTVESINRTLASHGLRSHGGKGRGALPMSGKDAFILALMIMMGVSAKDAPDMAASISSMILYDGSSWIGENPQWSVSAAGVAPEGKLAAIVDSPAKEFPLALSFGDFLGKWIDGILDPALGTYQSGSSVLEVSSVGPNAVFTFQRGDEDVVLKYAPKGVAVPENPAWERKTIVRDELFAKLAAIVQVKKS